MARLRNKNLNVKVTEEELNAIKEKMKHLGLTNRGEFVRLILKYGIVKNINFDGLDKVAKEINQIGVNINQIAKIANSTGSIYQSDLIMINDKMDYMKNLIIQIYDTIMSELK